jgi:plastocyanin
MRTLRVLSLARSHGRIAVIAILGLLLGACTTASSPAASVVASAGGGGGTTITITAANSFGAAEVTVAAGGTVTFVNSSSVPHTVTEGDDGQAVAEARFDEQLATGASVMVTFDEAGDYQVTCKLHGAAGMNMIVHAQ